MGEKSNADRVADDCVGIDALGDPFKNSPFFPACRGVMPCGQFREFPPDVWRGLSGSRLPAGCVAGALALGSRVLAALLCVFFFSASASAQSLPQVCLNDRCFSVEIADEPSEQRRGLMFRRDLAPDHGMLFVFEREARYGFWMKNTLIPLDMIWLDSTRRVVFIQENAVPCPAEACESYQPSEAARYVLELNAGMARQIGLNIGDRMRFEFVEANAGPEKF